MNTPAATSEALCDEQIVAELFRLARSERYRTLAALLEASVATFPDEPLERIKECLRKLENILWETDHGGYATEYKGQRTRKGPGLITQG